MNRRAILLGTSAVMVALVGNGIVGRRVVEAATDPLTTTTEFGLNLMPTKIVPVVKSAP